MQDTKQKQYFIDIAQIIVILICNFIHQYADVLVEIQLTISIITDSK